jgi:hypothetical protein
MHKLQRIQRGANIMIDHIDERAEHACVDVHAFVFADV